MNICPECSKKTKTKFCNSSCAASFNNKNRKPRSEESRMKTSDKLKGRHVSLETRQKLSLAMTGRQITWNMHRSEETKQKISRSLKGKKKNDQFKKLMSDIAKNRGLGGNTSKKKLNFEKKDGTIIYLQSSYEIEFATILEELNIEWSKPTPFKWIDSNGEEHKYYADFKIGNVYIDTKNDYLAIADLPKIIAVREQNNIDIRIVTKNMINKEFIGSLV